MKISVHTWLILKTIVLPQLSNFLHRFICHICDISQLCLCHGLHDDDNNDDNDDDDDDDNVDVDDDDDDDT